MIKKLNCSLPIDAYGKRKFITGSVPSGYITTRGMILILLTVKFPNHLPRVLLLNDGNASLFLNRANKYASAINKRLIINIKLANNLSINIYIVFSFNVN